MGAAKTNYKLSIKTAKGEYKVVSKVMTRQEFEHFYDEVVAKGGKVIGIF